MTLTEGTSTEIARHLLEEHARQTSERLREVYTAGTFGQSLPPLPTMSARYHFLSGIESDAESINSALEVAGEGSLRDELYRFLSHLWELMEQEAAA